MAFCVHREVFLICRGRPPSSGAGDRRFVMPGAKGFPAVHVWPGFLVERTLDKNNSTLKVRCSVRESENGPLFCCSVDDDDDLPVRSVETVGSSMTSVVQTFLHNALCQLQEHEEPAAEVGKAHSPRFFGLRTSSISKTLAVNSFRSADQPRPTCDCDENEDHEEVVRQIVAEEKHTAMNVNARVRWNGVAAAGIDRHFDNPSWTLNVSGEAIRLRAGFTSVREVQTCSGIWTTVICRVKEKTVAAGEVPLFDCSAELEDRTVNTSSPFCRTAVREILMKVNAVSKHKWSEDFFGFSLSSVRSLLSSSSIEQPAKKISRSRQRHVAPLLVRLQHVRRPGAFSLENEFLLVLAWPRHGFNQEILADMFGLSDHSQV